MRTRLLVVRVIALPILLVAGSRVWPAPAAPPLRAVGFLVLPGVPGRGCRKLLSRKG